MVVKTNTVCYCFLRNIEPIYTIMKLAETNVVITIPFPADS